jgi:hypothetical protein
MYKKYQSFYDGGNSGDNSSGSGMQQSQSFCYGSTNDSYDLSRMKEQLEEGLKKKFIFLFVK